MKRGVKREHLPQGIRQDTRKHTRHILRPPEDLVKAYLAPDSELPWDSFRSQYMAVIQKRFVENAAPFDALAQLARTNIVYLGCSCPTAANPRLDHCHTWLALEFMERAYPDLEVSFPELDESHSGN